MSEELIKWEPLRYKRDVLHLHLKSRAVDLRREGWRTMEEERIKVNVHYGNYPGAEQIVEKIKACIENNELFALASTDSDGVYIFVWSQLKITHFGSTDAEFLAIDMQAFVDQIKILFLTHKVFIDQEELSAYLKSIRNGKKPAPFKSLENVRPRMDAKPKGKSGQIGTGDKGNE